jgi:hypothetical protein
MWQTENFFNNICKNMFSRWLFVEKNWPTASQPLALLVIFLLSWGIVSSLFPGLVYGNSTIMRIVFLVIGAQTCGILVSFIGQPGKKMEFKRRMQVL